MSGLRERVVALARDLYEASAGHYGAPSLAECEALALAAAREAIGEAIAVADKYADIHTEDRCRGGDIDRPHDSDLAEGARNVYDLLRALSAALSAPKEGA